MRDDIHKSAPVNSAWRQFLKRCVRESDREDRARESAEKALGGDCRREVSREMLRQVLERCDGPGADLFGSRLAGLEALGGHVMEQQFISRLQMAERTGVIDQGTVERVLSEVITERAENQARAMRGHILKEGGRGSAECVQAINKHIGALPVTEFVRVLVSESGRLVGGSRASTVGLDENLL